MEEFKLLMMRYFINTKFFFQKSVTSSLVIPTELMEQTVDYGGTYEKVTRKNFQPLYNLCIASDDQLPLIAISTFDCRDVYRLGVEKSIQLMKSSLSYRLGNFLLFPFKYLLGK